LYSFGVLGLVSSALCQEIGWEERVQNYLFCVYWDVKPQLNQSIDEPQLLDYGGILDCTELILNIIQTSSSVTVA